jgi:hypothetical protein
VVHLWGLLSSLDLTGLFSNTTSGEHTRRKTAPVLLKQPNARLRPEQIAKLVQDYLHGTHLRELAAQFAISESTVKRHIRTSGVPHRKTWAVTRDQVGEANSSLHTRRPTCHRFSGRFQCGDHAAGWAAV